MARPSCEIVVRGTSEHLEQIFTGFEMLARCRRIHLSQRFEEGHHNPLEVRVADGRVIYFDLNDSAVFDDRQALERADSYFKRSYSLPLVPPEYRAKVFPLGLNYAVYADGLPATRAIRLWRYESLARFGRRALVALNNRSWTPFPKRFSSSVSEISFPPSFASSPRVLFFARGWDPKAREVSDFPELQEERFRINETRAQCIRMLRAELGSEFSGGLAVSKFSAREYPDILVKDERLTHRAAYLSLVREHPICIATYGLHKSNGWKLGEYVAMSRAIVSEPLAYAVPGDFREGKHFVAFDSPESCVSAVLLLREDSERRAAMMQANQDYYRQWLRPDRLVGRALVTAGVFSQEP